MIWTLLIATIFFIYIPGFICLDAITKYFKARTRQIEKVDFQYIKRSVKEN